MKKKLRKKISKILRKQRVSLKQCRQVFSRDKIGEYSTTIQDKYGSKISCLAIEKKGQEILTKKKT